MNKLKLFRTSSITIEETVYIDVPANIVWNITVDINRWKEWNPSITAARRLDVGPLGRGSVARIKQPLQPESDWTVTEYVHEERFTWETRRTGLRMAATHYVQGNESGTLSILRLQASGIRAVLLWPVLRVAIRHALKEENRALKAWCEAFPASGVSFES